MLTVKKLHDFGVNTDEGLSRCINNEAFYLRLVNKVLDDAASFDRLAAAVESGDKKAMFEVAHSLKGVLGNLSLTPLYEPTSEMTELLRAGEDADYKAYVDEIRQKFEALKALRED